jgi:alcohol dehydrogenase class IV
MIGWSVTTLTKIEDIQNADTAELATITHEPMVEDVDQTLVRLKQLWTNDAPSVLAVGGGSAIDLAKAVAALATNDSGNSVIDYLEGVGRGLKLVQAPLPVVAVPTTAGTGSEATKNAVTMSAEAPTRMGVF